MRLPRCGQRNQYELVNEIMSVFSTLTPSTEILFAPHTTRWPYLFHSDLRCIPRHRCIGNHWPGQYRHPHSDKDRVNIRLYLQENIKYTNYKILSLLSLHYFLFTSPNIHQALSIPYQSHSGPRWIPQDKCNRNRWPSRCSPHHSGTDSANIRWYLIREYHLF